VVGQQADLVGVPLVHAHQGLDDPLVLRDEVVVVEQTASLAQVPVHEPLDALPLEGYLLGRLNHARALEVDALLDLAPLPLAQVQNGNQHLSHLVARPGRRFSGLPRVLLHQVALLAHVEPLHFANHLVQGGDPARSLGLAVHRILQYFSFAVREVSHLAQLLIHALADFE